MIIKAYKERKLDLKKPVRIHRNLHQKNYSIKQNGVVVAHTTHLALKDCQFIVSKAGQARVRATKEKNVHAFIEGKIYSTVDGIKPEDEIALEGSIRYNPYVDDTFTMQLVGGLPEPVDKVRGIIINSRGVTATNT